MDLAILMIKSLIMRIKKHKLKKFIEENIEQ